MVTEEEKRSHVRNSVQATPSPLPRYDQRTCQLFSGCFRRSRRRAPVRETREVAQDEQGAREIPQVLRKDIQVVVAIAMPCRSRRISSFPMSETWRDQDVRMSYSIGVHAIPWNGKVSSCSLLDCRAESGLRTSAVYD